MTTLQDDALYLHATRAAGKVLVITGAGNGIGREVAIKFAELGTKVVIGDLDLAAAEKTVDDIKAAGGQATAVKVNVTSWDDQCRLFEVAQSSYGSVDIVIPNAGIGESGRFGTVKFENGKPVQPNLFTLDVNLKGALYTAHLAQHYMITAEKHEGDLKSIIFMGSMASWVALPGSVQYAASKHSILGAMRSLSLPLKAQGVRVACIHPFFAETAMISPRERLMFAGIPLTPMARIVGAIVSAATDPDLNTTGSAYVLPDSGLTFRVSQEFFTLGIYGLINKRVGWFKTVGTVFYFFNIAKDVRKALIGKKATFALTLAAAMFAWRRTGLSQIVRPLIQNYIQQGRR